MVMNSIGFRIRFLRTKKGISMASLGKAIGTDSANVSNWENNKRVPGGKFIIALSEYFNITTDWLLKGEKEEKIEGSSSVFLEQFCEFSSRLKKVDKQDQHFIRSFIDFYIQYKNKAQYYNGLQHQKFIYLPLLKEHIYTHRELLHDNNFSTYIPIPIELGMEGQLIYSKPIISDSQQSNDKLELYVIKITKQLKAGQIVLATYQGDIKLFKLINDKSILRAIEEKKERLELDVSAVKVHGVVTGIYQSIPSNSP